MGRGLVNFCRDNRVHYWTVKFAVTVAVAGAILAPSWLATHAALSANLLWIWLDP